MRRAALLPHTSGRACPAEARVENCSKPKSRIKLRTRPCRILLKLAGPAQISATPVSGGGGGGLRPLCPRHGRAGPQNRRSEPRSQSSMTRPPPTVTLGQPAPTPGSPSSARRAASVSPRARPGRGRGGPGGGPRTCGRRQRVSRPCPACWNSSPPRSRSPLRASVVSAARLRSLPPARWPDPPRGSAATQLGTWAAAEPYGKMAARCRPHHAALGLPGHGASVAAAANGVSVPRHARVAVCTERWRRRRSAARVSSRVLRSSGAGRGRGDWVRLGTTRAEAPPPRSHRRTARWRRPRFRCAALGYLGFPSLCRAVVRRSDSTVSRRPDREDGRR